jgi:hypothetical protein
VRLPNGRRTNACNAPRSLGSSQTRETGGPAEVASLHAPIVFLHRGAVVLA